MESFGKHRRENTRDNARLERVLPVLIHRHEISLCGLSVGISFNYHRPV